MTHTVLLVHLFTVQKPQIIVALIFCINFFCKLYIPQCLDISWDTSPNIKVNRFLVFSLRVIIFLFLFPSFSRLLKICSLETAIPISIQNNVSELLSTSAQKVKQNSIKSAYAGTYLLISAASSSFSPWMVFSRLS